MPEFVEPEQVTVRLEPGDQLILYTDGLLDSVRPRLTSAELVERLAPRWWQRRHEVEHRRVDRRRSASSARSSRDDTAVLVLTAMHAQQSPS